ncbi:sugar ABC transporter substrate-binding protein [Lachnospiraceae bacterium AM25-11LB]|nr:sugar ABC transporter substrate-binding protein [Lachnospiraceae bacterium AM25-22]RGD08428.1 sugar ABC transporter substrate-binding protein [Lachnospiraceae bacterium AM25-11LB]RJW12223.1 sugar ABC transporter substrate-binding protein [Lachnospiraceae bacterium AM25-40]RJW16178.1 sugar ABC transporter substrate-binding protein [Lachnospiraceae bacterium AM25-39]
MKKDKKMFIFIEAVLGTMVLFFAFLMLREKNVDKSYQISVIVENADDTQWSAFKYGLKMAAEDKGAEMVMVSTGASLSQEEEKKLIEEEIKSGADGVIVQPVSGEDTQQMLKKVGNKAEIMLVDDILSGIEKFPVIQPDAYAIGKTLVEELLKDYGGNLEGKTLGILNGKEGLKSSAEKEKGFIEALQGTGAEIVWSDTQITENMPDVDFVIALDDNSLRAAGEMAAANNLHGAIVYGIGNSTQSVYYLDMGIAECLVIPDTFNVGYQSLTELVNKLEKAFYEYENQEISYTVMRKENMFSKENQEVIFTMSQ